MLVIECKIVPRFFKFTASDLIVLVIVYSYEYERQDFCEEDIRKI